MNLDEESPIVKLRQFRAHQTSIRCTALGQKSVHLFATGGMNKSIKIWKTMGAEDAIKVLQSHYVPEKLAFDNEEELLISGCGGGHLQLYDLNQGKMVKEHHGAHHTTITSVSFYPFGNYYSSAESKGSTIKIWDIRKKNNLQTYKQSLTPVTSTKFSPDGQWLVSGEMDGSIKIWELTAGKLLYNIKAHDAPVQSFEFHPNDFLLASVSTSGDIKMWDLETFNMVSSSAKTSSVGEPQVLTFNPSGECLISGTSSHLNCYTYEPSIQMRYSKPSSWRIIDEFVLHRGFESTFTISRGFKEGYVSVYKIKNQMFEQHIQKVIESEKKSIISPPPLDQLNLNDTLETEVVDQSQEPPKDDVVADVPEEISLTKSTNDETKKLLNIIRSARFDMDKKHRERERQFPVEENQDDIDTYHSDTNEDHVDDDEEDVEEEDEEDDKEEVVPNELVHERSPTKPIQPPSDASNEPPSSKPDAETFVVSKATKLEEQRRLHKEKKRSQEKKVDKPSSIDSSDTLSTLLSPHVPIMAVLTERQRTFDLLRNLWHDGHHEACLDRLAKHLGDTALSLDVIDNLLIAPQVTFFNVALYAKLIPIIGRGFISSISSLHALLYLDFVERSLCQLKIVMNNVVPKINTHLKHRSPSLQSSETVHISRCHKLLKMLGRKANVLKKSSKISDLSREIIDRLQSL